MVYMGGKGRFAAEILSITLNNRRENQWYVEPFAGGMNMIDKVKGRRIANDVNSYLIEMWKAIVNDNWLPDKIDKNFYKDVRENKDKYENRLVGWVGFNCSFRGKFFGGFAGEIKCKNGTVRDYQKEARNNTFKQIDNLKGVIFKNESYLDLKIPPNSIIYCDPPYQGTTEYSNSDFNHEIFWQWVRDKSKEGHNVFVSEYNAPDDFICIWEKEAKSSLSTNGKEGGSKTSVEKLFKLK